ncbi:hypothetical protein ACSQ67_006494 [Phaseolus vulgaris]
MLTCIARPKKPDESDPNSGTSAAKSQAIKSLTSQIRDMALKASGAYKHCAPCTGPAAQGRVRTNTESDADSDRFRWSYRRTGSSSSTTTRTWGKEMEARLKGISSGEGTPNSASGRRAEPLVLFVEENEPKEWVAQVEPGVLITFVSLPGGGNDLKRIRFRYVLLRYVTLRSVRRLVLCLEWGDSTRGAVVFVAVGGIDRTVSVVTVCVLGYDWSLFGSSRQ